MVFTNVGKGRICENNLTKKSLLALSDTYTTRSPYIQGFGEGTGFKVEPLVNGVKTGQELWFSNASGRLENGTIGFSYGPGQQGEYWTSNGYILQFFSGASTGRSVAYSKSVANSVRCVR